MTSFELVAAQPQSPSARCPRPHSKIRTATNIVAACTALLLVGSALQAQPRLQGTQLLFEPVPIPQDAAGARNLTTLAAVTEATDARVVGDEGERRQELQDALAGYLVRVGANEAPEGPFNAELPQELLTAARLAQQLDQHERALALLLRAQNVSRLNASMTTLAQVPIMEAIAESHLALGQQAEADAVRDDLFHLYEQAYGEATVALVPALQALADWNLRAFLERSNIALSINRMDVNKFMYGAAVGLGGARAGDIGFVDATNTTLTPLYKLYLAQTRYFEAINILTSNRDFTNPQLLDLERKLLTTQFLRTHQENIVYEPDFYLDRKSTTTGTRLDTSNINLRNSEDYDAGLKSLQRRMAYLVENDQRTAEQVASTMLEEADWELLFVRNRQASDKYAAAYQFFSANPQMTATITDLVYPAIPVVLPIFLPAANSREKLGIAPDAQVSYFGYFDVSFSIQKNGKTRRVRILDKGGEVTANMELRLNDYLKNLTFRPRYKDGKPDTDTLTLRYYVGY